MDYGIFTGPVKPYIFTKNTRLPIAQTSRVFFLNYGKKWVKLGPPCLGEWEE